MLEYWSDGVMMSFFLALFGATIGQNLVLPAKVFTTDDTDITDTEWVNLAFPIRVISVISG